MLSISVIVKLCQRFVDSSSFGPCYGDLSKVHTRLNVLKSRDATRVTPSLDD